MLSLQCLLHLPTDKFLLFIQKLTHMTEVQAKLKNVTYEGENFEVNKITEFENGRVQINFKDSIVKAVLTAKEFNDLETTGVAKDTEGNLINSKEAEEYYKSALAKIEKTFDGKNQPEFKYYVVTNQNRIISGHEFKEDAQEKKNNLSLKIKTISRIIAKRDMGEIDVENEESWGDKNYSIVDSVERAINFYKSEAHKDFNDFVNLVGLPVELKTITEEKSFIQSIENRMKDGSDLTEEEKKFLKKMLSSYSDGLIKKYQKSISYSYNDISRSLSDEISNVSELIGEIK